MREWSGDVRRVVREERAPRLQNNMCCTKMSWAEVRNEMVTEKHLDPDVADRIKPFVEISGNA